MTTSIRLLAVDDDQLVLDLLKRGLAHEGMTVDVASSHVSAAQILSASTPDLVLVDANIPGMSHAHLAELVGAHPPARFVIFSAEDPAVLRRLASGVGAHGWLSKSAPLPELARQLRDLHAKLCGPVSSP